MSDYDHDTGLFTLTQDEARHFHTDKDRPAQAPPMTFYADKLRQLGFEVTSVSESSLIVKAAPDEVWEALSGQTPYL